MSEAVAQWVVPEDPAYRAALAAHPAADIYHDPQYLRSVATDGEPRILLLPNMLVLPLIVRQVPDQIAGDSTTALCDAESPYGYAAPLFFDKASGGKNVDWALVARELAGHGVVNAFMRNHPLHDWGEALGLPPITRSSVALIPLSEGGRTPAFSGSRCATHRSQVKRAGAQGFVAEVLESPADLTAFRQLYEQTMERVQAAGFYRFGEAAWQHLVQLGARLALITVRDAAGAVHNQALFLRGPHFAHYHLSARSADAHNAAGHLQFEAAADWAIAHGCSAIHLGGGTSGRDDDGLLAYKRRIGRTDAIFRTAGLIADPLQHAALIARWQQRSTVPARWFQAYRQPFS